MHEVERQSDSNSKPVNDKGTADIDPDAWAKFGGQEQNSRVTIKSSTVKSSCSKAVPVKPAKDKKVKDE